MVCLSLEMTLQKRLRSTKVRSTLKSLLETFDCYDSFELHSYTPLLQSLLLQTN